MRFFSVRKRKKVNRPYLTVIAGLFIASSMVRISQSADTGPSVDEGMAAPSSTLVDKNLPACTDADHIRSLLAELQSREVAISQEELRIVDRLKAL